MPTIGPQMSAVMRKSSELTARFSFAETPLSRARELYAQERMFWNSGGPKISCIMETNKERCVPVTRLKEDFGFWKGPEKGQEIFSQKYLKVKMNQVH